jgi:hypothetical protein
LKGLYQELVDPRDRHDLGEYYTPEWLCERIVTELLPTTGFTSVLDPACGSGSFLRAAIAHLLRANSKGGDASRLRSILENVVGIDIHPLAVTISRATYTLALGSLVKSTKRPIQIPVYLADSLFLPTEVRQHELFGEPAYEIAFGGRRVHIAEALVDSADLFDPAIATCLRVALSHADRNDEDLTTLKTTLRQEMPLMGKRKDFDALAPGLWDFTEALAHLIRSKKDSIWAFIVRNGYRPAMLRRRFDVILGNPPWLSYRYIADLEYQAEVKKRAVEDYRIAPKAQKLVTQMELATIFLVHALKTFGRNNSRMGFVMPRSLLSADQHANLRERTYRGPVTVERYWDLWDVSPVFNVPSCVMFATRQEPPRGRVSYQLPAVEWKGRLPVRDLAWKEAAPHLRVEEKTARLIYLATRSALSTQEGETKPTKGSPYRKKFRQGATIVPRNLYFVSIRDHSPRDLIDPERLYWAETDLEQAKSAKPPYQDVRMEGPVEGHFLYLTALSENLLPFRLIEPKCVVLPLEWDGTRLRVRTASHLKEFGYRDVAAWMREAEAIWKSKRGGKAKRQTLYERLDYHGELTNQDLRHRHLVLYNAAGSNLSAAHVDRESMSAPFVVEHKLYWMYCRTSDEADYLAAILNSEAVNEAIKPFQSTGLMGERDIEKKVLDLPIPLFRSDDSLHRELVTLGVSAGSQVRELVAAGLPASLARRRAAVRKGIANTLAEIDLSVRELIQGV